MRRAANRGWSAFCGPAWLYMIALTAGAQTPKLQFDVASVKPSAVYNPTSVTNGPGGTTVKLTGVSITGGPGSASPDRYTYRGANFRNLIVRAYGLVDRDQQVSGPGWIDSEHYDLAVTMPASTTETQFQQMLQNLLAERFKLMVHHGTKMLPVYELVVGKNGPKVKESVIPPPTDAAPAEVSFSKKDKDGFVVTPPGYTGQVMTRGPGPSGDITQNWFLGRHTMAQFARFLKADVGRNVIDKTGLTGEYDIRLYYEPLLPGAQVADIPDHPILSVFDAVEQQLGLKLVDAKAPFDLIVVDSGEKVPTEN
jgi:uncharacterized protein (TIGR03435 family)